jgi:glycosyltransferase involved in cell wall biosynthesis
VPFFNNADTLDRALESARGQTFRDIEILCVDDASEDGSLAVVQRHAGEDDRIRILRNGENQGIHRVRCRGVREARGEFILSLDGDDALELDIAEAALALVRDDSVDVIDFDEYIYGPHMRVRMEQRVGSRKNVPLAHPLRHFLRYPKLLGHLHRRLVRRTTYLAALDLLGEEFCAAPIRIYEDIGHAVAIYKMARRHVWTDKIGYHYYRRPGSVTKPELDIAPEKLQVLLWSQLCVVARILGILHPRQRPRFRESIFSHLKNNLTRLHDALSQADYASFMGPFLSSGFFPGKFSLGDVLAAEAPELLPGGSASS